MCLKVGGHWELSESEVKGDDDAPLGKDSCHTSIPCGNISTLEQVHLWKQVNLFRSSFVDALLLFYLSNNIANILRNFYLADMLRVSCVLCYIVARLTARPPTQTSSPCLL